MEVKQVMGLLKTKKEGRETSTVKLSESLEKAVSQMKTGTKGSVKLRSVPMDELIHHEIQDDTLFSLEVYDSNFNPVQAPYGIISEQDSYISVLTLDLDAIASALSLSTSSLVEIYAEIPVYETATPNTVEVYDGGDHYRGNESIVNSTLEVTFFAQGDNPSTTLLLTPAGTNVGDILFDPTDIILHVYTEAPVLSSIEVTTYPYETRYMEGETFLRAGMKILARYEDTSSRQVHSYTCSPSVVTSSSRTITVSYTERGVTKTCSFPVDVYSTSEGYYGRRYLGGSLLSSHPSIILPSLSFYYDFFTTGLGSGTRKCEVTLSYVSNMPYRLSQLNKGLPSRFMFSFQQHLLQDGGNYKYIDSHGFVHVFEPIEGSQLYTDIHGQGLTLTLGEEDIIEDLEGNRLHFDGLGRLSASSNRFEQHRKTYIYDEDGTLLIVYDDRDVSDSIEFTYYPNRVEVSATHGQEVLRTYILYVSNDRLTRIDERVGEYSRKIYTISYDSLGLLYQIIDEKTGEVTRAENEYNASVQFETNKILHGVMENDSFLSIHHLDLSICSTPVSEVIITDENNLHISYQLNRNGEIVSCFEKSSSSYRTTQKRKGIDVSYTPDNFYVPYIQSGTVDSYPRALTLGGSAIFHVQGIPLGRQTLSLYIFLAQEKERVVASLSQGSNTLSYFDVDAKASCCWQRVDIPFVNTSEAQQTLTLSFAEGETPLEVLYCGVRVIPDKGYSLVCSDIPPLCFSDLEDIMFKDEEGQTLLQFHNHTDTESFMTENDFLLTWKRHCLRGRTGGTEVFLCNGRKRRHVDGAAKGKQGLITVDLFSGITIGDFTIDYLFKREKKIEGFRFDEVKGYGSMDGSYVLSSSISLSNEDGQIDSKTSDELYDNRFREINKVDENNLEEKTERFQNGEVRRRTLDDGTKELVLEEKTMDNRERITSKNGFGSVSLQYTDGYDLPWRLYYENYDPTTGNYTHSGLKKEISYNQYMDNPNTLVMKQGENEIEKHIFTHEQQERSFSDQGVTYRIRKERLGNHIKVYAGEDLLMEKTKDGLQEQTVLYAEEPYTSTTTYDIYGRKITSGPLSYHYISNSGSPIAQDLDYIEDSSTGNIVHISYADGEKVGFTVSDTNNNPLFGVHKSGNKADYSFSGVQSETREEREDSVTNIRENTILYRQNYTYQKDSFHRISSKTSFDGAYTYTYLTQGNRTFTQVDTLSYQSVGGQILLMQCQFSYDGRGNISKEDISYFLLLQSTHTVIEYVYDSLSRLTEVKKDNVSLYSYAFNSTGRLSSVLHNGTQRTFTYDSKGRLSSSVVDGSDAFSDSFDYTYDNLGNRKRKALHYSGQTKEIYSFERGNLLSEIKDAYGNVIVSNSYDGWGRRWTKTSAGITHTYYYDDDNKLIGEDLSDNRKLRFYYDKEGICGFSLYRNSTWESFSYVRNLHGDILFIRDSQGKTIVKYEYSPYGEVSSTLLDSTKEYIRQINPFLYRGYYYDKESSLYYLLSRYYDPSEGVFLTMDDINMLDPGNVSGLDLYCYCRHNPVMYVDPDGKSVFWWLIALTLAIAGLILTINDIIELVNGGIDWVLKEEGVQIKNSYKIHTPWIRLGYLIYLKYFNTETKGKIRGSIFGAEYEWFLHNVAYLFEPTEQIGNVDLGATIFQDKGHKGLGIGMKITYMITHPILLWIYELMIGGWGNDFKEEA